MGDIKKVSTDSVVYENQLINILRNEDSTSKKQFKLKGPSGFLFSNFAMLALAACGGGGGGGGSTPTPPPSNTNNNPSMGNNAAFSFTEDTGASFSIGAPTDPDGDSLTITVTSIPTGGVLTLVDGTVITAGSTLTLTQLEMITFTPNADVNSDVDDIGDLVLTVSDGQGGADSATFSFLVTAVNDAPTDISLSALSVDENSIGATIGTITSEDVDSTSATYALSGTDASFFEITADGELKLKEGVSLDFEAKSSLDVTVTATDSDGATFSKTFSISVTDLNDAPTSISLTSLLFDENSAGANLGAINVIDEDLSGGDYTFAITGADKDSFEIVNGELKLKDTITADYETKDSYSITISATDADGNTVSENLTLLVNNKPDPESLSGTVVDGYVSGSTVKLLDANGNVLATATTDSLGRYTLEASDSIGTRIVAEGGVDTSTGEAITVTLSATKGSAYVSALTTILDQAGDDAATVLTNLGLPAGFDITTSNPLENLEAQQVNASLINIMAIGEALLENSGLTDGEGDELIVAQLVNLLKTSSDFNSATAIKGVFDTTILSLDAEIQSKASSISNDISTSIAALNSQILQAGSISQIATVQKVALDDEGSFLTSIVNALSQGLTSLTVLTTESVLQASKAAALDLNVNVAPFITLDALVQVKENIIAGDGIVTALASDPEGDSIVYSLSGSDAELFTIDSDGKVSFKSSPNYSSPKDIDTNNSYIINVIATDSNGNSSIRELTIQVLDVKGQGQAIDGYLVGAIVWADLDGDGLIGADEPTTTTDATGSFGLDADLPAGTVLYVEGGYDLGTGKPNEQVFKLTVSQNASDGSEDLIISPVSTQIARAFAKGTTTLDDAQTKVAAAYGLDEAFGDITSFDPIQLAYEATSQEQAEAALTAQARNIMVSTLGETSMKVSEYFTTEIAPVIRTQISDLFQSGTDILSYTSWDSQVDLRSQPRITIELEGFEELLAKSSEVFNDKIVDAILSSNDLTKLFEMKADGSGQFDTVINGAVAAIIEEIKGTVLEEMGFDPATNYTTFANLSDYEGETVTFLGSTKVMGEWAVLIADVLDSDRPSPFDGKVHFGPDGAVTDNVGKYFAERISAMARHIEVIFGKPLSSMTDDQIDQIVDMGMEYTRGATFNDSNTRWIPFDEYGQSLWSQSVNFNYSGERFRYDSNGNYIQGNSGNYQLTPDQIKEYLKDSTLQLKTGNWGNDFTTYNWQSTQGDLGIYLALSKARTEDDVTEYMNALTTTEDGIDTFKGIIDSFFEQGTTVFTELVTAALEFTLDKFEKFVERTIDIDREEISLDANIKGLPVSTINTVTVGEDSYDLYTTQGIEWLMSSWGRFNLGVQENGDFSFAIVGGPDAARFRIDSSGTISFADTRPVRTSEGAEISDGFSDAIGQTGANAGGISSSIEYDDVDKDGDYYITVAITEGDFTQEYDIVLKFPQWDFNDRDLAGDFPSLDPSQYVIEVTEHTSTLTRFEETRVIETEEEPELISLSVAPSSSGSGNKYYLTLDDGTFEAEAGLISLVRDKTYIFDQSDSSNVTHGLHIGTIENDPSGDLDSEAVKYYLDDVLVTKADYMSALNSGSGYTKAQVHVTLDHDEVNLDAIYYWCDNHANMGSNILTQHWEDIANDGFILSTGSMEVRDPRINDDGTTYSTDYSTSLLGVSATNPASGISDIQFSYFNNLNLETIQAFLSNNNDTGSPSLRLFFKSIPEAGTSGTATLNALWANGRDSVVGEGSTYTDYFNVNSDSSISTSIAFNWSSDGENITITIPDQTQTVTGTGAVGELSASITSVSVGGQQNIITSSSFESWGNDVAAGQGNVAVLQIDMLQVFGAHNVDGVKDYMSSFFKEGAYRFEADFDGLEWSSMNGFQQNKSTIISNFDINSNTVTAYAIGKEINEGEGGAVDIRLTGPLDEDITIEYFIIQGDVFGAYPAISMDDVNFQDGLSSSVTIEAGQTRANIDFYAYTDSDNDDLEAFTVIFPQFQNTTEDGIQTTEFNGINWGGSSSQATVVIRNTEVISSEYKGLELLIENAPGMNEGWIDLRHHDNQGNPILDNEHFHLQRGYDDQGNFNGKYYLEARNGTFDFDDPMDSNGDNVYELELFITRYGQGDTDSVATKQQFLVVVKDGTDPTIQFWSQNPEWSYNEASVPVASIQTLDINGKSIDAFFASGQSISLGVDRYGTQYLDDSGTPEARLFWPHGSENEGLTYAITGGADADKFLLYNDQILFKSRPSFDNPEDADNDNRYEVEVTVTAGEQVITNTYTLTVEDNESGEVPFDPPEQLPIYFLKETPELIGDSEAPKNIRGSDSDDTIKVDPHRFQYIQAGKGDDILDPGRNWEAHGYFTGGEGNDVYIFRQNYMTDMKYFGIRDYSQPDNFIQDEYGNDRVKDGINGYDQNRDGVLDFATELDWTRVVLISDFTPGEDTIALTTTGETGFGRAGFEKQYVTFAQGTGELANHTLVLYTGPEAENRGYEGNVGLLGILLDTDVATLDATRDIVQAGAQYETVLGKFDLGGTTVDMTLDDGSIIQVQQLPNGDYVWFEARYDEGDNQALYQVFTVSTDGIVFATRPNEIDYENPRDGDLDNIYQFQIRANTFSELSLEKTSWGDIWVDWQNSERSGEIQFTAVLNVQDDINDNLGKISIAETSYMNDDGSVNQELIELVLRQISAVQSSMADIDMRSIAEEINFDFSRFTTASAEERSQEWFQEDIARRFDDWGRELEETFEQNLINKYNDFTDAYGLGSLVGDATDNIIKGEAGNETIFGKAGDDTIAGGEGDDVLFGDTGNDTLSGGPGIDRLDGGAGADRLIVDEGADVISGGAGDDTIYFSTLTEIPEFVDGGGGNDTLVLAGLPENIGDTSFAHDNAAYTGIDLKKIVSAKETWKWTDEEGNEVTEEGWRNRLESIETIDLRDSSSLLNVEQDATPYEGFRLSSNYFTVTDYIGGDENSANTYKTKVIPYSEAEVGPSLFNSDHTDQAMVLGTESVLNYTNLQKLFSGDGTGKAPVFSFELESIPDAGEQGVVIVNFTLSDGYPDYWFAGDVELDDRFGSTKTISANIKLNWISDGTNVKITMKPQTVEVQYESGDVIIEKQWENLSADILSIKPGSNGTPTLDLKLTNLFANNSSADGIDMSAFFTEGRYFLTTEFEGLDIQTATTTDQKSNSVFNAIQTLFRVEESSLNWYSEDVVVDEATGLAQVTVNLSRAVNEDVNFTYFVYPATYGFINDEDTLEYVNTATGADFGDTTKWTGPNGENYPIGTVTIPAGQTSATVTIPINDDGQKETSEYFLTAFFADSLSDGTYVSKASRHPQVEIENSTTFQDVLNIDLDTLWRMSWDSRTWTIRGDDHDTVRLVGYESNWTQSDGTQYEYFEPFRFEGQQTVDGVLYNVYDLWDARVLIEDGVTVIYKKRDLGKVKEGENSQPDFWYKWGTVKENETSVYGAVRDSYDQDGDTITYSIDENYRDGWLFDIDSATGELTWKVAPDYEAPNSFNVPSGMTDFSNTDDNQMRHYNSYQVKVIGNDGSGEDNATVSRDLWIDVKNVPDYEGYDPTNKIPFFRDMWGEETQFIDDATNQSVKIKGFDLDFDDLTWEITGLYAWGKDGDGNHISDGWGTIWGSYRGNSIDNAPLEIDQNGYVTPKTTLSYEDGYNNFEIIVSITDGKSNPVTKQYNLRLKDSLADGSYEVNGHAQLVGYLSGATVFQDLDNDGIQDGNEPFATTSARGQFTLALNKAVQDTPILVKGGIDLGTGLENDKVLSINANLPFATNRDWGEYSMTPLSAVTLALQNLDRSVNDRDAVIDITKALGFENGWVEGDGNYHGDPFHQFMNGNLMSYAGDWDVHQMNLYVAQNLVNILGDVSSNASTQIAKNVLTDIMAIVEGTSGAAGVTQSTTITNAQAASIETKAYNALLEAIAEVVSGLEAYDGFRLGKSKPVKIIDHEMILGSYSAVNHTPDFTVANGVMTLNTNDLAINRSTLQDALDLKDGAKGLIVEVEVGALPTTAETITFTGRLIDGTDASIDTGERAIEISFKVSVDPTQEIGSANYVYVPAGEAVTVTYTGEDGTVTETTVDHGDVMVTIENPITGGAPVFKVDMMEVFKKGIPLTDLSTYFDNDDGSVGEYYTELNFANSSLQTSDGDSFTKVVAPFSVSDSPTPIAYVSDVEVNESRGWTQVEVSLSKPAESDIVINYKFDGGTATKDVDYWWWSDQSGYRQITFLEGQSNAVINLDVRWDDEAEADETFNIELVVDSESQGKVSLGTDSVTVTIIDDDGASNSGAIDSTSLTEKVLSKVNSTLIDEIKSVLDSNSGTLNSSAATYSEILVGGNSEISDVTAYITAQLTTETGSYDDIIVAVMDVVQQWTSYLRGPNQTNLGNKIDAPAMATDIAALTLGLEAIDLTAFEGVTAANLATAITTAIYTDSGFKFNGPASISNEQVVTPDKTVETDSVYNEVVMPAGKGLIGTRWDNVKEAQLGTSGDDTVTVTKSGADTNDWDDIYYSGGAGDDVITGGGNNTHFIQGGVGDDTLKTTAERYHRLEGGPGDDILSASNFNQVYYSGGTGSDVFVIESSSNTWTASASFDGHDRNWDGTVDLIEFWQRPGAIADFKSGTDKIGLRGDWSNKTIVVKQGTMEGGYDMSEHTILYAPDKNDAGEYTQIIGIIANTFATNITSADFVTLDASYNQTALSTSINFASSITFNGGKNVGPAQSNVLIYNANDSSATTFSITGGNDASMFTIDSQTGALFFKESVTADTVTDFNRDGSYDVQVTASTGGTDVVGNVAVSVSVDTVTPTYSDLALVQETNSQGESVVYLTGTLTDAVGISEGSVYINLRHESKGTNIRFEANDWRGTINDDGSFQTQSKTLDGSTPDGKWYVESVEVSDNASNRINEYYRGAIDSSPLTATITNAIYLGNDDTTIATYSDLAIKVEDGKLSVTGKFMDDGSPLTVGEFSFEIYHTVTGARKWFNGNTEQMNADGTFETRSEDLRSSDPSGLWVLNRIELTDDAGNKFREYFDRGSDSNPMQATLDNPDYLGDTDKTAASASNFSLVETTNYEGKPAIQITGKLVDDDQALTSGEVGILLIHTKSGNSIWLDARDSQIDQDGNFETWIRTLENDNPSGTWYISQVRVKDDAGNQTYDNFSQDSSPLKVVLNNSSYSGGQSGDASGTDFTAPAYADLAVSISGENLTISGVVVDPNGIDDFYIRFKNAEDASASKIHININDSDIDDNGSFSKTVGLDNYISGTYIADDWRLEDDLGNSVGGSISTGATESPELGLSFAWTNAELDSTDKSVPVLSNLVTTVVNDGDDTYTLKVTGTATDTSDIQYVSFRFQNVNDPNASDINISASSFDASGNFTINANLDDKKGGTWNATRVEVKDKVGNSESKEIDSGGSGSALNGLTFDLNTATENASDKTAAVLSDLSATVTADGDGTFSLVFSGTATDDSSMDYLMGRFENTSDGSEMWIYVWSNYFTGSSFSRTVSGPDLDNKTSGKYVLTQLRTRDQSGNEKEVTLYNGGLGSPIENLSFNYGAVPTDISFSGTTIAEETLGASLGEVKVNGVDNDGLYTLAITGTDASSLEISSKGYLRLKDNVKLDYETKTTLEFTITATNATNDSYSENFTINVIDNGLSGSSIASSGFIVIDIDSNDLGISDTMLPGNNSGDIQQGLTNSSYEHDDLSELGIELETYSNEVEDLLELDNQNSELDLARELEANINASTSNEIGSFNNIHSAFTPEQEEEDLLIINEII